MQKVFILQDVEASSIQYYMGHRANDDKIGHDEATSNNPDNAAMFLMEGDAARARNNMDGNWNIVPAVIDNHRVKIIGKTYTVEPIPAFGMFKHNSPCLLKAAADEPIFVLRAKDPTFRATILSWVDLNMSNQPHEKLLDALKVATAGNDWLTSKTAS